MEKFENLEKQCKKLIAKVNFLDVIDEEVGLTKEEIERRRICEGEYWEIAKRHESFLHQKSRTKWIKDGDGNTILFFHNVINWRRRKNAIKGLQLGGRWIEDPCRVKRGILDLFKKDSKKFLLRGQSLMEFNLIICKI